MAEILNKCPVCGSKIEYSSLMQYSNIYSILNNGKLSKKRIRKEDNGTMECGFIHCTNSECDFHTDCDLDVENNKDIRIFQNGKIFMYEIND